MKFFLISVLVVFALAVAWKINFPSGTWRYKVTVEIETPEGVKSGSAVHLLYVGTPIIDLPDVGNSPYIRGEAVAVDLGERGIVFALMTNQPWRNGLYQAFPIPAPSSKKGIEHYIRTLKPGMKAEWKENWPRMVMFKDINDPKSVTLVRGSRFNKETQQSDPVDDFEAIFGAGVKLRGFTVEITDEPVTWNMKNILPWLSEYYGKRLDGDRYGTNAAKHQMANNLSSGAFSTGE